MPRKPAIRVRTTEIGRVRLVLETYTQIVGADMDDATARQLVADLERALSDAQHVRWKLRAS